MLFWKTLRVMNDLIALQHALGLVFRNPSLLEQALIHPSYLNENPACL